MSADIATLIVRCLWLAAPTILAGVLHMAVVKRGWFASLAVPLDGRRTVRGVRIFGDNKTVRGVIVMIAIPVVLGALQGALWGDVAAARGWSVLGDVLSGAGFAAQYAVGHFVFGAGYGLGELPNSFLKRQLAIAPGQKGGGVVGAVFFVVDQADSVVCAFALGGLFFPFGLQFVVFGSMFLSLVHLAVNVGLAATRIKREV
jgi:hypothetical protein